MRHKIRRIHFVGIGGAGMCGLAEVMCSLGFQVSGSDMREQPSLQRLRNAGIRIAVGHDDAHVADADCVVFSGAVAEDNPERVAALARGIPTIPRAQMLGEVLRFKPGVAIAGTHGKTTVASMLAAILAADGSDPTCIIGGRLLSGLDVQNVDGVTDDGIAGSHARIGQGEFAVVEADESDASFLHLQPVAALVTNIDNDHLSAFDGDVQNLRRCFYNFLGNLPFYGAAVLCADDVETAKLASELSSLRVVLYGCTSQVEVFADDVQTAGAGMKFVLHTPEGQCDINLSAAGMHNVQNATGACAMARELGVGLAAMAKGLQNFGGVGRRLESHGDIRVQNGQVLLIDDYAHHPTEIEATVAALRGMHPKRRLVVVFQPHRYTRTRDVFASLVQALRLPDCVVLLPVYAAGEHAIANADSAALASALQSESKTQDYQIHMADNLTDAVQQVLSISLNNDVVVTMGAGDIGTLPSLLKAAA